MSHGKLWLILMPERSFNPNSAVCCAAPGGKLYDAYVSHLHPNSRSNKAAVFALQILPEKLETQHGYSLYIRGRDDSAGEGLEKVVPLSNQLFFRKRLQSHFGLFGFHTVQTGSNKKGVNQYNWQFNSLSSLLNCLKTLYVTHTLKKKLISTTVARKTHLRPIWFQKNAFSQFSGFLVSLLLEWVISDLLCDL